MDIGDIIRNRRMELGLTLEEIGAYVGVGKSTVKKWESGYIKNIKRDKIALLSEALKLSPLTFITGEIQPITISPAPAASDVLTEKEQHLLTGFRGLNELGQEAVLTTLDGFTHNPVYKKCPAPASADKQA